MSSGAEKIRQRSQHKFAAALERLKTCTGTHPRHAGGKKIKIIVASVAREARMGRSTLHRFPELCEEIRALAKVFGGGASKRTTAEQVADAHTAEVAELNRQIQELLEQNLALTMRIAKYEPKFTPSKVVPLGPKRPKKRTLLKRAPDAC